MTVQRFVSFLGVSFLVISGEVQALDELPKPTRSFRDRTGDGIADLVIERSEGGSGYRSYLTCIVDGKTRQRACVETQHTAYALFAGERIDPSAPVRLREVLEAVPCRKPNRSRAEQGAMWALLRPVELGVTKVAGAEFQGRPRRQELVCFSPQEALHLPGSFAWDPSGDTTHKNGWRVFYRGIEEPQKVAEDDRFEVWTTRTALALYDRKANHHTWIVNDGDGTTNGFKVDRWTRFSQVRIASGKLTYVHRGLASRGQNETRVELALQ